jgi:hypothetical protein
VQKEENNRVKKEIENYPARMKSTRNRKVPAKYND